MNHNPYFAFFRSVWRSPMLFFSHPNLLKYNWNITLCRFKVYNMMIWYICVLWNCVCVCVCVCVWRTVKIYSLSNFQVYNTVLLTPITLLDIRSPKLAHPRNESLYPLTNISPFSPAQPQPLATTTELCFCKFGFFFLSLVYLFWRRESVRARTCQQGRGRERGRQRIPSRLQAVSAEPDTGPSPTNWEIMTWAEIKSQTQLNEPPRCPQIAHF